MPDMGVCDGGNSTDESMTRRLTSTSTAPRTKKRKTDDA